MTVWFTVQLEDRPGSLARVATALGERGVNITGIVGVAEDTDGAFMLTTSDAKRHGRLSPRWRCRTRSTTRRLASPRSVDRCRPSAAGGPATRAACTGAGGSDAGADG